MDILFFGDVINDISIYILFLEIYIWLKLISLVIKLATALWYWFVEVFFSFGFENWDPKSTNKHCDMDDVVDLRIERVLGDEDEDSDSSEGSSG